MLEKTGPAWISGAHRFVLAFSIPAQPDGQGYGGTRTNGITAGLNRTLTIDCLDPCKGFR